MAITFYYGSGSPFSWYVWLVLEQKKLPYDLKLLSLQGGDLKTPDYLAIHPKGKVPAIIDGDCTLWESTAIVEYLEDRYPENPILAGDAKTKADIRRQVSEAYGYLYPPLRRLMEKTLMRKTNITTHDDKTIIDEALVNIRTELDYLERTIFQPYMNPSLTAADFAVYPLLALVRRVQQKIPTLSTSLSFGPKTALLMKSIEALPFYEKTYPPHWKG
jgi:glutathione S-transferase